MSWNYRIVRHIDDGIEWYAIHEAYYWEQDHDDCSAVTENPVKIIGDNPQEVIEVLERMLADAKRAPALDYETRKDL